MQNPSDMNSNQNYNSPQFAAALSTEGETSLAVDEVCRRIRESMTTHLDLAIVFVSHHHVAHFDRLASDICEALGTDRLVGCTGESIVGTGCEMENQPAISLWAASFPQTTVVPMRLRVEQTSEGQLVVGWPDDLPTTWPAGAALIILADPYSFPAPSVIQRLNEDQPGTCVLGGMASGGMGPGKNALFFESQMLHEGAVAVWIHGATQVHSVVSQGCRPIGRPFVITKAEQNVIQELGGRPAVIQLKQVFDELSTSDQALVQNGLHVGSVVNEYQDQFELGDFLVRNVEGLDPDSGAIAVGDFMRPGKTIQFHVRDQHSADAELRELLSKVKHETTKTPVSALLFTCNGRGTRLFTAPDHDAGCVQEILGDIPVAGFFAQGELGPVGGKNFLHGFTASIALFR